jgi:MtrB/PioB family decaheme-associated outer membrane protein
MKKSMESFVVRACVAAVRLAVLSLPVAHCAYAADAEPPRAAVAELTEPTKVLEIGIGTLRGDSYKFREYNGLPKEGPFLIGNIDVNGGGRYDSNDPTRWRLLGTDLGLDTRALSFDYAVQGRLRLKAGYDELRRNQSDTYQTPYLGAGTDHLTLPATWVKPVVPQVNPNNLNFRGLSPVTGLGSAISPAGVVTPPTAAQTALVNSIIAADVPLFNNFQLGTTRRRYDGAFLYAVTPRLELAFGVRSETKKGTRLMGSDNDAIIDTSIVMPDRVDTTTNLYDASLRYTGDRFFAQAAYYGAIFRNKVKSMTWEDPSDRNEHAVVSSAPSNQFHQLGLTGGYNFSPATKLVANARYGRNTQNDSFLTDHSLPLGIPTESLHGLVVTKELGLKLTTRPSRGVNVTAGYKFDERDNRTPVNTYVFYDVNLHPTGASPFNQALGLAPGTLGSNINIFSNRPLSKKLNQFNVDADYALAKGQNVDAGFEYQDVERHCEGTWINCTNAPQSREGTLRLNWRANLAEAWNVKLGYAFSRRKVDYDPQAWLAFVPMANVIPGSPIVGATTSAYGFMTATGLTGFGPLANFPATPLTGNAAIFTPNNNIVTQSLYGTRDNVSEIPGMRRFNLADRDRNRVRGMADWQPTERLSFQGSLDYDDDDYTHSQFGLQKATTWALNLEGGYLLGESFTASTFYSYEDLRYKSSHDSYGSNTNVAFIGRAGNTLVGGPCLPDPPTVLQRNMTGKMDPCLLWSADNHDTAHTAGIALTKKGLAGGRVQLAGDVAYSRARTKIAVKGGSYVNNPLALAGAPVLPAGEPAIFFVPAADLPTVTTDTVTLRLAGRYLLTRHSSIGAIYLFQRMKSSDYAYEGMQFGTAATIMPSNEQAPNYRAHVFGVFYSYSFH